MFDTPTESVCEEPKASMAIVARFDGFANYLYPMLVNTSRHHRVVREVFIESILMQYQLFHIAGKTRQVSALNKADAGLAYLKDLLRFMAWPDRKLVSRRQYEIASVHIAETGAMLGTWIKSAQKRSGGG